MTTSIVSLQGTCLVNKACTFQPANAFTVTLEGCETMYTCRRYILVIFTEHCWCRVAQSV
jgi:hypothetical protein